MSTAAGVWKLRVDTGGTFTDVWARAPDGGERRAKVLSDGTLRFGVLGGRGDSWWRTDSGFELADGFFRGWRTAEGCRIEDSRGADLRIPGWPGGAVIALGCGEEAPVVGARLLTGTGLGEVLPEMDLRLATTRGTNALLERKGARLAFFVSAGFEDLLWCRDQRRERLYSLSQPEPEILPAFTAGVAGRLAADGGELLALDEDALRRSAGEALAAGCRTAAVALLHAWRNPSHERRVAEILESSGFDEVTVSSEVAPLIRLLPRAETAVADAFLKPVMKRFIRRVTEPLKGADPLIMTSAGGLVPASRLQPKDSLLSGPAGGLIGAAECARAAGFSKVLSFDMGGTSTDVARIDGPFEYRTEQRIGPARVMAPALRIETVAAGGGSICRWREGGLSVGPESAGADPGPACYGRGGPLTLTDVNLMSGFMDAAKAGIPLDERAARARLHELIEVMRADGETVAEERELLAGLRSIAVEKMAEAIRSVSVREGVAAEDYALLAFGGAGPQHACAIAGRLGVSTVLVPGDAGLLSARGLDRALRQEQRVRQVLEPLARVRQSVGAWWRALADEAATALKGGPSGCRWIAALRLAGQDSTIEVEPDEPGADDMETRFRRAYRQRFGYPPAAGKAVELESLRVVVEELPAAAETEDFEEESIAGPRLMQDRFSTCVLPEGWSLRKGSLGTWLLESTDRRAGSDAERCVPAAVRAGLFRSRFEGLVEAMGEMLRRTALSTNIKERLDYSCALLDGDGRLVASAPHVPVHLGALGVCVREVAAILKPGRGDVVITNHPGAGGSHLPDVTLIAPVHDAAGGLIGYVANRAHHAEIGGSAPGSMPAGASCLAEEGVVIAPRFLVRAGRNSLDEIGVLLRQAPYPSRRPEDNLADLEAQLAACHLGRESLRRMAEAEGSAVLRGELEGIVNRSAAAMRARLGVAIDRSVADRLDDGTPLALRVEGGGGRMRIDFGGSGGTHAGNLNATPAIVRSVVLYVLRLWIGEDLPLNEGLLEPVELVIPEGILNPDFGDDPGRAPAVVGGNVETSQRLADLLLEAFGLAANGAGTMNNFLFGDGAFGYYETLAGGSGAGPGFAGASGRQVHMTNTALTDPEVLEHRYPVRVWRHGIRRGSGGEGRFKGGDGIVREIEFLKPLTVSFLTQRRLGAPRGLEGGEDGASGRQRRIHGDGSSEELPSACTYEAMAAERVVIETPGGGGWGTAMPRSFTAEA